MQLRYVFSETGTGLRRNVSMTVALVVTIFVSLTLVGMGILLNQQAQKAQQYWGSKLQITVFLCNQNSTTANCVDGEVTPQQKQAIESVLDTNTEVASWDLQSKQEAYAKWKSAYVSRNDTEQRIYQSIRPSDMQESYWVQLKDPERFQGVKDEVGGLAGVNTVRDLREGRGAHSHDSMRTQGHVVRRIVADALDPAEPEELAEALAAHFELDLRPPERDGARWTLSVVATT